MSNPSNLYAEKIYSEHPTMLWALDDKLDYISLISEDQRDITGEWSVTNAASISGVPVDVGQPFQGSIVTEIQGDVPVGVSNTVTCISPSLINFTNLEQSLGTFCIGTYFYSNTPYLSSLEIGYEYTDTTTSLIVQHLKTFNISLFQNWGFISETFSIPDENTNLRIVIKANMESGGASSSDYSFMLNGISIGQWSEEFNTKSLGIETEVFPSTIDITTTDRVVSASSYGVSTNEGYYLVKDNLLLAKNTNIPLVFGASNVTKLLPNSNDKPSLIIPGKGFLNESGRYKDYTVEFWARINSDTYEPKRIFGPIGSTDGLYVEAGFLTLVIGKTFRSHFVGEWFRPMLIHIRIIKDSASVLLNGEEVISFAFDSTTISLPSILNSENNKELDWLGFYAYENVNPIEIDCVAIYPYKVPITVAKRRWVYGQGVISPEGINSAYGGTTAFIDYPFADYSANYTYPDFAQWQQGVFDNLNTTSTALSTPQYELPDISLSNKTLQQLYDDNQAIQNEDNKFITFKPNSGWNSTSCYFNFPKINILNDEVHVIYSVIKIKEDDLTEQTIIQIYNTLSGNYFSIRKDGPEIHYYLYYNGIEEEIYTSDPFVVGDIILVGIDIEGIVQSFGGNVATFFGDKSGMKVYVGGDESGLRTFTGNIYSVGLSTSFNESQIEDHFYADGIYGIAELESGPQLLEHLASYTLLPTESYNKFFLDIGISGYWEDYLPLSYFAKYVENDIGNQYYDLDFLQFNIGYPSPSKLIETEETSSWSYQELEDEYKNLLQRSYSDLDNSLYSGFDNYTDLYQKSIKYFSYNTQNASIKSYITFQYIADGSNELQSNFTTTIPAREDRIIDINDYPSWMTTKFEVVDNTLIYPLTDVDFNDLSIVCHLEFNIKGILTKPVLLRRLELASQVFNNNSFNAVGTRFGIDLFPYKRSGLYYDYKSKNPFSIYKGSTPYLYLNRNSGIEVRGDFDASTNRGIAMPINRNNASNYRVSAIQMWIRYDQKSFTLTPIELFEVDYKEDIIKFFIVADSETGLRGRIYAQKQSDGSLVDGISYYVNGTLVREPVLTIKDWSVLGITFPNALRFDYYVGSINMNGPAIFNNIAYYQANSLQQIQSTINRPWLRVKQDGLTTYDWQYWLDSFTWQGVLVLSASDIYGVNPSDVYKTYLGINKIIIDDSASLIVNAEKIKIYNNSSWSNSVSTPI